MTKQIVSSLLALSVCIGTTACSPNTPLPGSTTAGDIQQQTQNLIKEAPKLLSLAKENYALLKKNAVAFKPVFQILSNFGIKQASAESLSKPITPPNIKKVVQASIGDRKLDPSKVTFDGERFLIDKTETKNVVLGAKPREKSLLKTNKFQSKLDKAAEKIKAKLKTNTGTPEKTAKPSALTGLVGGKQFKNSRALFSPDSRANAGKLAGQGVYVDQTLYCVVEDDKQQKHFVKFVIPASQIEEMAKALNDPGKADKTVSVGMKAEQVDKEGGNLFKTLSASSNPDQLIEAEEMEEILEDLLAAELSVADSNILDDIDLDETFLNDLEKEFPELAGDLFEGENLDELGDDELDEILALAEAFADAFELALEEEGFSLFDDDDYYDEALEYFDEFEEFDNYEDYELSDEELEEYIDFFDDEFEEDELTDDEDSEDELIGDEDSEDEFTDDEDSEDELIDDEDSEDELIDDEDSEDELIDDEDSEDEFIDDKDSEDEFIDDEDEFSDDEGEF